MKVKSLDLGLYIKFNEMLCWKTTQKQHRLAGVKYVKYEQVHSMDGHCLGSTVIDAGRPNKTSVYGEGYSITVCGSYQ